MRAQDLFLLLTGVLLNAAAQLGLKAATRLTGDISLDWTSLGTAAMRLGAAPAFWGALLAYGLSVLVWVVGLSRVPVSQAYPLLSLGYVITALAAWQWLDEPLSALRVSGIALVIGGVYMIARS